MGLREQIFAANDEKIEPIEIPEWGPGPFFLRMMTSAEADQWEARANRSGNKVADWQNIRATFAVLILCDAQGARLFSDADAAALGKKSYRALSRVWAAGQKLHEISQADVEALLKNSDAGPSAGTG
jgi:hypothetical protein